MTKEISSIAIAGEGGTGKTTMAEMIRDKMGWDEYGAGKLFRDWTQENNGGAIGAESGQDEIHDIIDMGMLDKMTEGSSVVEGRVAGLIAVLNQVPNVFSVLLLCDPEVRYRRIFERDPDKHGTTIEDVGRETEEREAKNRHVFKKRYDGEDYLDPKKYDLAFDNTELNELETMTVILWVAGLGELADMEKEKIENATVYLKSAM